MFGTKDHMLFAPLIMRAGIVSALGSSMLLTCLPAHASAIDRPYLRAQSVVIVIAATEDESNGGVAPVAVDFNLLTPASSGAAAPDLIADDGFVFNSNSGFDPGHDFSAGATRLQLFERTSGGNFGNPGGGDIDYLEESDTLTAFGIDATTDISTRRARHVSRFLVVSNARFDIYASASNLSRTGDFAPLDYENIGMDVRLNRTGGTGPGQWGTRAQNPAIGGTGLINTINDLGDISTGPTKVFDGGRRTARFRGSLLEQSVSFQVRYALSDSADSGRNHDYDLSMGAGTIGADVTFTVYTP